MLNIKCDKFNSKYNFVNWVQFIHCFLYNPLTQMSMVKGCMRALLTFMYKHISATSMLHSFSHIFSMGESMILGAYDIEKYLNKHVVHRIIVMHSIIRHVRAQQCHVKRIQNKPTCRLCMGFDHFTEPL